MTAGDPVRRGLTRLSDVSAAQTWIARHKAGHDEQLGVRCIEAYLIGGAYWMPPLLQSEFSPRGIFSFDPSPTLRS